MAENGEGAGAAAERERQASSALTRLQTRPLLLWLGAFALALVAFYAMDQLIMAGQGLPLNLDLTPAQ